MPAIKSHSTATVDKPWDGPGNKARLKNDGDEGYYRKAFAWQDPDGDPETKAAFKFIHHEVSGDGDVGAANVRGCIAGIAVLNGGRGGTTIPDADRAGVHAHLARHMRDADMEPPELKMSFDTERRSGIEYRTFPLAELRADGDGEKPKITGHAAVFDVLSEEIFPGVREQIAAGAFRKTIKEADIRALFNHDPNFVLGRNAADTLSLKEDKKGLAVEIWPPDTQTVRDLVLEPVRRGDVSQMSFAFQTVRDRWEEDKEKKTVLRTLLEVKLFDVSVVTFPAYPQTDAAVRSMILDEHRIDLNAIHRAMAKADHAIEISDEEREALHEAMTVLSRYTTVAPGQAAHPAGDATEPCGTVAAETLDTEPPAAEITETLQRHLALKQCIDRE